MPSLLAGLARQIRSQAGRLEGTVWPVLRQALEDHGAKLRRGQDGDDWRTTDCGFSEGAEFVCEPHREWLSELAR
ncbi:hypothetical protein, partial [Paraburkholderia sp. UYCP14C]|uniref:hypothetical protein n=1 Tax=Paraburkholderia sp. UYCP14C TaxID=2511130 RepID=UPI001B7D4B18